MNIDEVHNKMIRNQFIEDWLLVVENDDRMMKQIDELKDEHELTIGAVLYDEYRELVSQIQELVDDRLSDVGALLVNQIMMPPDSYTFELIAKHFKSRWEE
jgi:predicted RecB family nuclease